MHIQRRVYIATLVFLPSLERSCPALGLQGLEPVAEIFKQHVEGEGQKLVKAVTEEIESKKEKDTGG